MFPIEQEGPNSSSTRINGLGTDAELHPRYLELPHGTSRKQAPARFGQPTRGPR
jgi:hypothetical protein